MARWLWHPWIRLRAPLALGLLFVVAAWPKLADPPAFAKAVYAYHLLPAWGVIPVALVLPWLETACGLALLVGAWRRAAALCIAGMLALFCVVLGIKLAQGQPVDCGCFTVHQAPRSREERFRDMKWTILRDLGMLALAAHVLLAPRREREAPCG